MIISSKRNYSTKNGLCTQKSEKLLNSSIDKTPLNQYSQKNLSKPFFPILSIKKIGIHLKNTNIHIKNVNNNELPLIPVKTSPKNNENDLLTTPKKSHKSQEVIKEVIPEQVNFNIYSLSIEEFRKGIIGRNVLYDSPLLGQIITLYADDTASGRPHEIVERYIRSILPFYANTHSDNSFFAVATQLIYEDSLNYMKEIFNTPKNYEAIGVGTGSTGAIFRFQEILMKKYGTLIIKDSNPPIVIITEYEHHSNILSWHKFGFEIYTIDVSALHKWDKALMDLHLKLSEFIKTSPFIVISTSACSNVTSQITPMKLVGPGSCGMLIFNTDHYDSESAPTHPAGGTVNAVYNHKAQDVIYSTDILDRESAGTPGILQVIRTKEAFALQDKIGLKFIEERENQLKLLVFKGIKGMNEKWKKQGSGHQIEILGTDNPQDRSSVFSVVFFDEHGNLYPYQLMQRILNDVFGIQLRSGCNCAGPFGVHLLENIYDLKENLEKIVKEVKFGDFSNKPGWIRFNVHFSFTDFDLKYLLFALEFVTENGNKIFDGFYEERNGTFRISKKFMVGKKMSLNMMTPFSLQSYEVKEANEEDRVKYLEKTMKSASFLVNSLKK